MNPLPGRITTSAPANPTSTALHRRHPTLSRSSGTDSAVTISGAVNPIAEAVASGTLPIAMTNSRLLASIRIERPICTAGRRVRSSDHR